MRRNIDTVAPAMNHGFLATLSDECGRSEGTLCTRQATHAAHRVNTPSHQVDVNVITIEHNNHALSNLVSPDAHITGAISPRDATVIIERMLACNSIS